MAAQKASRIGILVLGMHRAGTSLLGQSLGAVGCSPPRTLIGPSANNEGGYWESRLIQSFNDDLLSKAGTSWDDWQPVTAPGTGAQGTKDQLAAARGLIEQEFGDAPLFVLKEPRICRLVPFWLQAMEGIDIRVILALRNPLEVAASLARRNAIEPGLAHLMWLSHMLEAEAATRGLPRVVTRYEALLTDWQGTMGRIGAGLKIDWPDPPGERPPASEALRHHRHSHEDLAQAPGLPGGLVRAHAILEHWSQTGEDPADHAETDSILAQLRDDARVFGPLVSLARKRAVALQSAERRIAGLETARASAIAERDKLAATQPPRLPKAPETAASEPLTEEVKEDLRQLLDRAMQELRAQTEAEARRARDHEDEKALSSEELARLTLLLQGTEADLAETRSQLDQLQQRHESLQQGLAEARQTADRLRHDLARTAVTARILRRLLQEEERRLGWIPSRLRSRRQIAALMATGLFDPAFYLRANPDVAQAGNDPAQHYLSHGLGENRLSIPDPERKIDTIPAENASDPDGNR